MSLEAELRRLLDQREIEALIARYSRTLDWLDDAGQASCYWPDAEIDYGFFTGTAADFVPVVMAIERASARRWHLMAGLAVRFTGPNTAQGECYGMAAGVRPQPDGRMAGNLYGGRYLDSYERRDGMWRISSRRYILDWSLPLADQPDGSPRPDVPLPILSILESGHPLYRPM